MDDAASKKELIEYFQDSVRDSPELMAECEFASVGFPSLRARLP